MKKSLATCGVNGLPAVVDYLVVDVYHLGTGFFPLYGVDFGKAVVAQVVVQRRVVHESEHGA